MRLPKGHLSPSQLNTWEKCQVAYKIFVAEGARAIPDFALRAKQDTHFVVLEGDLLQKIESGKNLADSDLSEMFRARMESEGLAIAREDPNLEEAPDKAVEKEISYFDKILKATNQWRSQTVPKSVEKPVEVEIGGVPVQGRIDLIELDTFADRITDLKRQGQSPSKGAAANSRQLATYAIATGILDVGLSVVTENVTPKMTHEQGQITGGMIERVTRQYEVIAEEITEAIEKDRWRPVDITDNRKAWACTKKFCGAWAIGSKDILTGRLIECPFGQRSVAIASVSKGAA